MWSLIVSQKHSKELFVSCLGHWHIDPGYVDHLLQNTLTNLQKYLFIEEQIKPHFTADTPFFPSLLKNPPRLCFFSLIKLITALRTNRPFLCPSCRARKWVAAHNYQMCICCQRYIVSCGSHQRIQWRCHWATKMAAAVRQRKLACTFKPSHIPFSPFSVSYLVSPPSEWSQSSGCWQADLFFSFKCYVLRDLDQ